MSNKLLMIGNGPSALDKEMGELIDNYDGTILRFNSYVTEGFESYVGSRTDFWWTIIDFDFKTAEKKHKARFYVERKASETIPDYYTKKMVAGLFYDLETDPITTIVPRHWREETEAIMDWQHPTNGAIAALYFISQEYEIELWGFDFMNKERRHHYADNEKQHPRGEQHSGEKELSFFMRLLDSGQIRYFGQRKPIIVWTCDVEGWAYHNRFLRLSKNLPNYDHRLYLFGDSDLSRIERVQLLRSADVIVCQGVKALRVARMKGLNPNATNYEDAKRDRFDNILARLDSMRVDHKGKYYDIWTGERIEN